MKNILLTAAFCLSCLATALGQPENDLCTAAAFIPFSATAPCPAQEAVSVSISGTTEGATASSPALNISLPGAFSTGSQFREVWYAFTAVSNQMSIALSSSSQPMIAVFQGDDCGNRLPIGLAQSTAGEAELLFPTEPGTSYFIAVGETQPNDGSGFELTLKAQNNCRLCAQRSGQLTASPAPANGTYQAGETVTFCYSITSWDPGFALEWLHGVEIDFGPGWDQSTLQTSAPEACTAPEGQWDWHESWESCNTGLSFGPGFAFDGIYGLLCGSGGPNDGNPGNNFGDGPCGSLEAQPLPLEFCWTITVAESFESQQAANLNLNITLLGDGYSGSWMSYGCEGYPATSFLATAVPAAAAVPSVSVQQAACPGACNGALALLGGQGAAFALSNEDGQVVFSTTAPSLNNVVNGLCAGHYELVITSEDGATQSTAITLPETNLPTVTANYLPACATGEPYQVVTSIDGATGPAAYIWTGPDGFFANTPNPAVFAPGLYTLSVTANGCQLPPQELSVISALPEVDCEATDTSLTFIWDVFDADTAYHFTVLSGQEGGILSGNTFRLEGLAPGTTASGLLEVAGEGLCPDKFVEANCITLGCPKPDAGRDTLLCNTDSIQLQGILPVEGSTFAWSPAYGLSCTDCLSPNASPDTTTAYTLTVTTPEGCQATDEVTVFVNELPDLQLPDSALTYCPGERFEYCLPEGYRYLWISPIGFVKTGNCLLFPYTTASIAGEYTIIIRLENGCKIEQAIRLEVDTDCFGLHGEGLATGVGSGGASLRLGPNPASDLALLQTDWQGQKLLRIFRADGAMVRQTSFEGHQHEIPVAQLPQGAYFLQLSTAGQTLHHKLTVVH
ncbi:T9SS type A sorting domain-containing protein [Phaeodactylibacter luteus]|uniref:T9SS type A sorting domain-containing protein n=1 Tax=Phaeodactylibacter luteus TaxID=1564516 RepID=A0A5C6RMN8_9BACT|nr:T9SS type A sorting domain-containing protein [Phaeodactylibacter luteus]TXB63473.1 T9SS type A sorting domain-containing protein [Phaeodactylibacter luteus]